MAEVLLHEDKKMLFTLNNTDYTANIVADTYKINTQPIYESYEDAKGITHSIKIRDRVSGTFDIFIRSMNEYNEFLSDFENGRNHLTNTHSITLKPNNINVEGIYNCFLKFESTRKLDGRFRDYMGVFTITVEER